MGVAIRYHSTLVYRSLRGVSCLLSVKTKIASAGNRTRAARVAGEHSTTEPPMLMRLRVLQALTNDS